MLRHVARRLKGSKKKERYRHMSTHLILLAAGEGTRMQSDTPKVLHKLAGAPLFQHSLHAAQGFDGRRVIVVGHRAAEVRKAALAYDDELHIAEQSEQLGTAHAVAQATEALQDAGGDTVVLYGDTPFITADTIARMKELRATGADIVFLAFEAADPGRYGRMVTDGDRLLKIVEFKDATSEESALTLCNSGVVMAGTDTLVRLAASVKNDNASGEFYLTDIPALGAKEGLVTKVATCEEAETLGVNSKADLAVAEAVFQAKARRAALEQGVTLVSPDTVHFAMDTVIGRDAIIEPYVVFGPGVTVESGAHIKAFSHLEGAHVGARAVVGPYARLRPGAELSNDVRVGNFVEVKNATIRDAAKVNHLSYVGDASIGPRSNVGAGTITCNYDGVFKHRTEIGSDVFIGSNTMLVAPVTIGDNAMTATGGTITKDVPPGDMAVARARQVNKTGFARRFFARLRAAKKG